MGKTFKKGLKGEDKKEVLLKKLKKIGGKNEEELKAIEDQEKKQLKEIEKIKTDLKSSKMVVFFIRLSPEAKQLMDEIKEKENDIDPENLFVQNLMEQFLTLTFLNSRLNLLQAFMMARLH